MIYSGILDITVMVLLLVIVSAYPIILTSEYRSSGVPSLQQQVTTLAPDFFAIFALLANSGVVFITDKMIMITNVPVEMDDCLTNI